MNAGYQVEIGAKAQRELATIIRGDKRRAVVLKQGLLDLAQDPRPEGCRKLSGPYDLYRIRISVYRIIYRVSDSTITVTVVRVAHRGSAYTGLDNL